MRHESRQLVLSALTLGAVLLVFEIWPLDLWLQDALFNTQQQTWLLDRHNALLRGLLYTGPKVLLWLIFFGFVGALLRRRRNPTLRAQRRGLWIVVLSLLLVPGVITGLKNLTNVACPADLQRYGGDLPIVGVFDAYPVAQRPAKRQRCFPAGHASGGYALLSLYYLGSDRRRRRQYLLLGLTAGTAMGAYKMLIGHHFLSHTLSSALLSWLIINLIARTVPDTPLNSPGISASR